MTFAISSSCLVFPLQDFAHDEPPRSWERESGDSVATGDAAHPDLVADFDGDGPEDQEVVRRIPDDLPGRELLRVDSRDHGSHAVTLALPNALEDGVLCGTDVSGRQQGPVRGPAYVVDVVADIDGIDLGRGLPA